jgi:hypothetical protein
MGQWVFTRKNKIVYAIYQAKSGESLKDEVNIPLGEHFKVASVSILGQSAALRYKANGGKLIASIPPKVASDTKDSEAWVFKIVLNQ